MKNRLSLNLLPFVFLPFLLLGQQAHLLKNINSTNGFGIYEEMDDLIQVGDKILFSGKNCIQPFDLFYIDLVDDSLHYPKNFMIGRGCNNGGFPIIDREVYLTNIGTKIFAVLNLLEVGRELWISDDLKNGPHLVVDLWPGEESSNPEELTLFNGKIWFSAEVEGFGRELWSTDGATSGTEILLDLEQGNVGADPKNLVVMNGRLLFEATVNGMQGFWVTDGTGNGTQLLFHFDLTNDPDEHVRSFTVFGDKIFMNVVSFSSGTAYLKVYDSQTQAITDIDTLTHQDVGVYYQYTSGFAVDDKLFFDLYRNNSGRELWVTDGTVTGTQMIGDINPGVENSNPRNFFEFEDDLYFVATQDTNYLLFKTDPDLMTTAIIDTLGAGHFSNGYTSFFVLNNELHYFRNSYQDLMRTDGANKEFITNWGGFGIVGNVLTVSDEIYFQTYSNSIRSIYSWSSQSSGPPIQVKGSFSYDGSCGTSWFVEMSNKKYFWANDLSGRELWTTAGDEASTERLTDSLSEYPTGIALIPVKDSLLVFTHYDPIHGTELWRSDGSFGSEEIILDLNPGSGSGNAHLTSTDGEFAYFTRGGNGLYLTDGTEDGTKQLMPGLRSVRDWQYLNGFYYTVVFHNFDTYIVKTDRTAAGTELVTKIYEGQVSVPATVGITIYNDSLFFFKQDDDENWGLWKSDGTPLGTELVKELFPIKTVGLTVINGRLLFWADDGVHGHELWSSDGSSIGTNMLIDLTTDGGSSPGYTRALGNKLLFCHTNESTGRELWISDGTEDGTQLLLDIQPGNLSSFPDFKDAIVIDSLLFFSAITEGFGLELWQTDGTPEGTAMAYDVCPGPCSSRPTSFSALSDGRLLFTAYSHDVGIEPWVYTPDNISTFDSQPEFRKSGFQIFPNPNSGNEINLVFKNEINNKKLLLVNLTGQVILEKEIPIGLNELKLPIEVELSSGLYFIQLIGENGKTIDVEKLFVSN